MLGRFARFVACDLFGEIDEGATNLRIFDLRIGAHQPYGAGTLQKAQAGIDVLGGIGGPLITAEEERDRHAEYFGNACQSPGAHPIDTLLILLDLLERYPDPVPQFGLRHVTNQSLGANSSPDIRVTGVRSLSPDLLVHSWSLSVGG